MLAPRIGLLYDWTKEGRSKIYAHWGRFYESIPMDINDRSFGGEVTYQQLFASSACGTADAKLARPTRASAASNGKDCVATRRRSGQVQQLIGASGVLIAPGIQAAVPRRVHRRLRVRDPRRSQDRLVVPEPPPRSRDRGRLDRRREHVHHREPRRVVADATRTTLVDKISRTDDATEQARLTARARAVQGHPHLRQAARATTTRSSSR